MVFVWGFTFGLLCFAIYTPPALRPLSNPFPRLGGREALRARMEIKGPLVARDAINHHFVTTTVTAVSDRDASSRVNPSYDQPLRER